VPLAETIVAGALLSRAGLDVPFGPLTIAPVHRDDRLTLARAGGGWRVSGTARRVPWGRAAGHVVTVAEVEGVATVALVASSAATVTEDKNLALEPRDTLLFDNAPALAAAAAPGLSPAAIHLYGAMVRSAQMAGALDAILEQGVRYATERKQFGRPIGNFQALQHYLAVVAGHVAASGIAAELAFRAVDRDWAEPSAGARASADAREPATSIAAAKIRVGEAAGVSAGLVHQVHGAIGFTYEHSLHFATRRLWSWRAEFGSESGWAIELGRRVAARGADNLWTDLTER
jgi:acyl-CoA dehydrogenase